MIADPTAVVLHHKLAPAPLQDENFDLTFTGPPTLDPETELEELPCGVYVGWASVRGATRDAAPTRKVVRNNVRPARPQDAALRLVASCTVK